MHDGGYVHKSKLQQQHPCQRALFGRAKTRGFAMILEAHQPSQGEAVVADN